MPGIVTAVEVGAPITFIKYQPPSKPLAYRPLAPSVTCGDSSLPEGAMGFCVFTLACCSWGSANCESLSRLRRQLPLAREPPACRRCQCPRRLSATRYFPDPPGIGGLPKAPLAKGGCLGTAEAGGFRRQSLRNFLPIPSSLFTKKPSPFHIGLYFEEVPTVNPSVMATPCQLPLAREPWGAVENKGPVVLLAAVVKPRLFRCKPRFHEMPRQGLSCRGLSVVFATFSEGYKEEQGKQG